MYACIWKNKSIYICHCLTVVSWLDLNQIYCEFANILWIILSLTLYLPHLYVVICQLPCFFYHFHKWYEKKRYKMIVNFLSSFLFYCFCCRHRQIFISFLFFLFFSSKFHPIFVMEKCGMHAQHIKFSFLFIWFSMLNF